MTKTKQQELLSSSPRTRGSLILIEGLDRSGKSTQCQLLASSFPKLDNHNDNNTPSSAIVMRFPDRSTGIGGLLNTYLSSSSTSSSSTTNDTNDTDNNELNKLCTLRTNHLLFSANRWELIPKIYQILNSGQSIILDRYVYSGIAYSYGAYVKIKREYKEKQQEQENISNTNTSSSNESSLLSPPDWLWNSDLGLPVPDLILFLTIDISISKTRTGFGEERYENVEMQQLVNLAYEKFIIPSHKRNFGNSNNNNSSDNNNISSSPWIEIKTDGKNIQQIHEIIVNIVKSELNKQKGNNIITYNDKIL